MFIRAYVTNFIYFVVVVICIFAQVKIVLWCWYFTPNI